MTDVDELSERARAFAAEYLIDFKARQAAIRAGFSEATASVAANNLLIDPRIQALITEGKRKASNRVNISVDNVLNNFRIFNTVSPADFFDQITTDGIIPGTKIHHLVLKPMEEWTDEMKHALKAIKHTANGVVVEVHDKNAANVQIGKFFGMFTENVNLGGSAGKALELIADSMDPKTAADLYAKTLNPEQS